MKLPGFHQRLRRAAWKRPTSIAEVSRRAGGRRAYNRRRQQMQASRRVAVLWYLLQWGPKRGVQAKIARMLRVDPSVISRDIKALSRDRGVQRALKARKA
jgi:hypothetical protein